MRCIIGDLLDLVGRATVDLILVSWVRMPPVETAGLTQFFSNFQENPQKTNAATKHL